METDYAIDTRHLTKRYGRIEAGHESARPDGRGGRHDDGSA